MTNHTDFTLEQLDEMDWEFQADNSIALSPEQIKKAAQISQPISEPAQQWSVYLHALALLSFEQWLEHRAPDLPLEDGHCSLFQALPTVPVCDLEVGKFKLCVLATGGLNDAWVDLSARILDTPHHFYVWVEVLEDLDQVRIMGYFEQTQLSQAQHSKPLSITPEKTCLIPTDWFQPNLDSLLLALRCLSPAAIPLASLPSSATIAAAVPTSIASTKASIPHPSSLFTHISDSRAVRWFQDRLQVVTDELSWVLLPAVTPMTSAFRSRLSPTMRSTIEEFEAIALQLEANGITVPAQSEGRYQDLPIEGTALRLYTLSGIANDSDELDEPEWTLLIVLGPQPGAPTPIGTKLFIWDEKQLLVEQTLTAESDVTYLYSQVTGSLEEPFWVAIDTGQADVLMLPPFSAPGGLPESA
jgi:hypothetical protein